ncbi:hypothetical protein [Actinotalea sp. JY-7876]|uniref:hypothetical protein n=1 Tax=Actinotalea sp. JY-7876 TaxID=2758442 RepID=UPI0015F466F7|nr:hypothetical protein [Actinotalea sp. JY-7876]
MTSTNPTTQWGDDLGDLGIAGIVGILEDPLAALDEQMPTGVAGSHWGPVSDSSTVTAAMRRLEGLLTAAAKGSRGTAASRAVVLTAVDRALADPMEGYLRRLRVERSRAVRELVAASWSTKRIAEHLDVSESRVRQIVHNNRSYVSAARELALEALRDQAAERRAAEKQARDAARSERGVAARAERVALGRELQARLDAGATRVELQVEYGASRQRLASLLAEARGAEADEQAGEAPLEAA